MIDTLLKIRGIGLLHDAIAQPTKLARVTTIYGENGRGKSTKSAILTSLCSGRGTLLLGRKTIGGSYEPEVALKVDGSFYEFKAGAWNRTLPCVCVFDSAFVNDNVYSGFDVSSDHRRRLLDFALGENGVQLKAKVDRLTNEISTITSDIRLQDAKVQGICQPLTVAQYLAIPEDPQIALRIEEAERVVEVANKAQQISRQAKLAEIALPEVDTEKIRALLSTSLPGIADEAKSKVRRHFEDHIAGNGEQWVKQGLDLIKTEDCPFCGQSLEAAESLLDAYQAYFDRAYENHINDLNSIRKTIESNLSDARLANLDKTYEQNRTGGEFWKSVVKVELPIWPRDRATEDLADIRSKLLSVIDEKLKNPMIPIEYRRDLTIHDSAKVEIAESFLGVHKKITDEYNQDIREVNKLLDQVKREAKTSDLGAAKARLAGLVRQKERHQMPKKDECERYQTLVETKQRLEQEKVKAREELEQFTAALLVLYESAINRYLHRFGAGFQIVDVETSNERGLPRVDYKLQVAGQKVGLANMDQTQAQPVFGNTLSDGDRRTLALAFFLARLEVDGHVSDQIVVIDDPVSSFDQLRRRATHRELRKLAENAKQLIVLSHDPQFIQSFSEDDDVRTLGVEVLELRRDGPVYTVLDQCDIEERVQSEYKTNYRTLEAYVAKGEILDKQKVVRAIRPMLEANLRHRFQDCLKGAYTLGKMLEAIRSCHRGDHLEGMKTKLEDLDDINDFATDFTHDSQADGSLRELDDGQLTNYCRRALAIARGI
jgi:wobble nucleotide-excising tRNase